MRNEKPIDMRRIEEWESKALLTPEAFKELGHYRLSPLLHPQAAG